MLENNKKINFLGLMMALSFVSQEALTVPVYASSDITGVNGNNGVFDIRPDLVKNDTGFRHYNNFRLSKNDIANLIFSKDGKNLSKFVNLVDNRIYINGILNTLGNDGKFYNGNAIFVSPNGMVVGSSGVLNVGSLTAIAPNTTSYLKYLMYSMPDSINNLSSNELKEQAKTINIEGITDEVNLKLLKEADQGGDIRVYGKIFARDSVELVGKNVNIGNAAKDNEASEDETAFEEEATKNFEKAGIMAGIPTEHDIKIATLEQANNIFETLVKNNVEKGTAFDRDALGNVIIKAQSIKEAELVNPNSLSIKGQNYLIEELFEIAGDTEAELKILDEKLLPDGLTVDDVKAAYIAFMDARQKTDAANPDAFNSENAAKVTINNAVIAGKNVDINAASKVTYDAEKGSSLFDRIVNTIAGEIEGETDNSFLDVDSFLDSVAQSNATFEDFEGARANASIVVGENTTLFAEKDVDIKSLATAETNIKVKNMLQKIVDADGDGFYYLGTKTASNVAVEKGANITAGEDVNVIAASKNSMNLKIKNPTSAVDSTLGEVANIPSIQVSIMQAVTEADTAAEVKDGAIINAGNNVNVTASNFTSDQIVLNSIAGYLDKKNSAIAVAVALKDTNINTSAVVDGTVNAGETDENGEITKNGNVSVNSQNMNVSYTSAKTKIEETSAIGKAIASKISGKVTNVISNKVKGIEEVLDKVAVVGEYLPSANVALVVNDSNINSTAKIGKNAKINATKDVNVDSAIIDMTVNTASGKLDFSEKNKDTSSSSSSGSASSYIPSGSVSVIVNDQKNNSTAVIEDGTKNNHAQIKAENDIKVNSTIEQPMNDQIFELALNLSNVVDDTQDLYSNNLDGTLKYGFGDSDWDYRVMFQQLADEGTDIINDLKGVAFSVKNSGISTAGLKGFFNNWAETSAKEAGNIGLSASVVVSDVRNNTQAKVGSYADFVCNNAIINAANSITQYNAAGQISKLWGIVSDSAGNGIGGTVIVESTDNNAVAEIGNNVHIDATYGKVDVNSANEQNFLTVALTGTNATSANGLSISGTTVVQNVNGKTESSIGDYANITANDLNVVAGKAKINKVPTALDTLQKDFEYADIDDETAKSLLEEDFSVGEIRKYTETDINLGIDTELGYNADDPTGIGVITGSGLAKLKKTETVNDGIKNMMLTGSLARQSETTTSATQKTSSGLAVGASVNVSQFSREVNAFINDNATINLANSLNVLADTKTQSLNIAIAGAFAGGTKLKKESFGDKVKHKAKGYLDKTSGILDKITTATDNADTSYSETGKFDSNGNPILSYKGTEYTTNSKGEYVDKTGNSLKDSSGNTVKANNNLGGGSSSLSSSSGGGEKGSSGKNMSAALAGSVNTQINDSKVTAKIGSADITVGNNVSVNANQTTKSMNIGGGVAKAANVGAGAAVNLIENSNNTLATVDGANIKFDSSSDSKSKNNEIELNVIATENNDNVQVAIGVGVSKTTAQTSNLSVASGDSFNADLLTNSVIAELKNATVENVNTDKQMNVNVNADNYTTSYKGAGGANINISTANSMSVGAGIAGNINIIDKTTKSIINGSTIENAQHVNVVSNKEVEKNTEKIVDVAASGSITAGGKANYSFLGTTSTNIISNEIVAEIINGAKISADVLNASAYNSYKNWGIVGALSFSTSLSNFGAGVGSVVNVMNSDVVASIENSKLNIAKTVDVLTLNNDDLKFIAVNFGVDTSNGNSIKANGIVNVIKNNIESSIKNSTLNYSETGDTSAIDDVAVNVLSDYKASIFGVTSVGAISNNDTVNFGANVLSNTLLNSNTASIENSDISTKGNTNVGATSEENINITPVSASITVGGTVAIAANVAANVVNNKTKAYIDSSTISSDGIEVNASDDTTSRTRGGTIAVSGSGTAAVSGAITSDTYVKDVEAYIDNSTIKKGGDIKVNASAKNIFGAKKPNSITASGIADSIDSEDYDVSKDVNMQDWDMTYDVAGSSTSAISGSIISKVVANDIKSYVGKNTIINNAKTLDVTATNTINTSVIAGNVSGASTAAVGGNIFSNVNTSKVNAEIENGVVVEKVGNVGVSATSSQINRSITFTAGGAGTVAVAGAVNSNIIVNETNAHIGETAQIKSSGNITVQATDSVDKEGIFAAVAAASGASVGDVIDVNVFNNKVAAQVGTSDEATANTSPTISADGNILLDASSAENYKANVIMVAGSGTAAVSAVTISNTMASDVKAGIQGVNIKSKTGQIDVKAKNSFNDENENQTIGLEKLLTNDIKKGVSTKKLESKDLIPLVAILNVSGSGTGASVEGTVVNNNVISTVDSYVKNAIVDSKKGLNLNAISQMTTYDAVMGVGVNGVGASVGLNGIVNTYSSTTTANIDKSTISGNVALNAKDKLNLNSLIFAVSANGVGAAVIPVVNTNTIANDVLAKITNSTIKNASTVSMLANNTINITDGVVAGSGNGFGASTNVVPITNVFAGKTQSYIDTTNIKGNSVKTNVEAENDINTVSAVVGLSGNGIGATVGGYAMTNVFDNDLKSYIKNSTITDATSTLVKSNSDLDMNSLMASGSASGVGAGVIVNSAVNVIKNNVDSYIDGSSITGGSINVSAIQKADVTSNMAGISSNCIGNATAVNSLVNVFTNNLNAYISDTSTTDVSSITVLADADETLNNTNIGVSVSGTAATSANSIVNVLENNSKAYIDAKNKTMNATGKVLVSADDTLKMSNLMGMATASGFTAAGANVNVNVINNAVKAELLSSTVEPSDESVVKTALINAGSIDVGATSTMALDEKFSSASLGAVGIAGNVIINSFGSKVDTSNEELNGAKISETLSSANSVYNNNVKDISYTKDNQTKTIQNEYSLTNNSLTGRGTIANVNASIDSQGEVSVQANNTVKGIDSDTLKLNNIIGAVGSSAAGASVLVNDMNYKTSAKISGGSIDAENNNINVNANSTLKTKINTIKSTIALEKSISGNVGYTKNSAVTEAIISSTEITDANDVNIKATSLDNIAVDVTSISVGSTAANLSVGIAETSNEVKAKVTGSNVNINTTGSMNITSSNTSTLASSVDALLAGGIGFDVNINRAKSNAITNALIDASGSVNVGNNLNIIAKSGGINATTTMNLGGAALVGLGTTYQGANVSSSFSSGIDNSNLDVTVANGSTTIKSGVNSSGSDAATVKAEVKSKKSSIDGLSANSTSLNATVNANSSVLSNAKSHKAKNISLISKLNRHAITGSNAGSIGLITFNKLDLNSNVGGSNTITVSGNNSVDNKFEIKIDDDSKTETQLFDAEISFVKGAINSSNSVIDTDSTINVSGVLSAGDIDINADVDRHSENTLASSTVGLASATVYNLKTKATGDTNINLAGDITSTSNVNVLSDVTNQAKSDLSTNKYTLVSVAKGSAENILGCDNVAKENDKYVAKNISVNKVTLNGATITAKDGTVNIKSTNTNNATMGKKSTGSGLITFSGGTLANKISPSANIDIKGASTITAENINVNTLASFGTVGGEETKYTIDYSNSGITFDYATIENRVRQTSQIDITGNSHLIANDGLNVGVKSDSKFIQGIESDGEGFVAKNRATSRLDVENLNKLNIDSTSDLFGNNTLISQDSSNDLKSYVDVDVSHFGGRDPEGYSYLTLSIDNQIVNNGSIKGGDSVQIDFMKNSINNLTQDSNVAVEAAVATGKSDGKLEYKVNNKLTVSKNANITSAKDVIANYTTGTNSLNSNVHTKNTSRILLGIPITTESKKENITNGNTNALVLDGVIVAGNSARRYMLIDKDGNIDTNELKGFVASEYEITEQITETISGEQLTQDAIKKLQNQNENAQEKITDITAIKTKYSAESTKYGNSINSLESTISNVNSKINSGNVILDTEVSSTMQNNIKSKVVLGKDETNSSKISQDLYDKINTAYQNMLKGEYEDVNNQFGDLSFETFLKSYEITPESTDSKGNVVPATKLSSAQITNFVNSTKAEEKLISSISGTDAVMYNGKIVYSKSDKSDLNSLKTKLNNSLTSLKSYKATVDSYISQLDSQITSLNANITANNNQITYLNANKLPDLEVQKASIKFDDLFIYPSKIQLNGLKNTSITGTGNFKTYSPNLVIDNYSNRDLVFKTIDLAASSSAGLYINGDSYADYMNSEYAVNETTKNTQTEGVHYIGDEGVASTDINNIIINNFHDNTSPISKVSDIASDITFGGYINVPNKLEIFNDSGDINFGNSITSKSKNIIATKGSVIYNAGLTSLILQKDDQILAGENVDIIAKEIKLNSGSKIQAGYASKSITITNDMLNNLAIDPSTGEKNMLNLGLGNRPTDLNAANNIKALYINGKILLFNTKQEGGSVKLTGTVTGSGAVLYTNGYATVNIDNQTSKTLIVDTLENNRMNGVATANNTTIPSTITVTNQAAANNKATTNIKSKGLIEIIGSIFNGKDKQTSDAVSELNIESNNGFNLLASEDSPTATIDAVGNVNITNKNSDAINVNGIVTVSDGNLTISNTGTNTTISKEIKNDSGDITISNTNGKLELTNNASITNNNGNTSLINNGTDGTQISGVILNEVGNIAITNNAGGLNINTSLTANDGNISTINNGAGGTTFTANAKVNAAGGDSKIEITNTNGGVSIAESTEITNESQTSSDNVKISNSGKGLLSFFGSIFNKKGNTIIENTNAESGVLVATTGIIKNEDGDISLSNKGAQDIKVEGKIENEKGNITVSVENSDLVIGEYASDNDNYISAENGNVIINQINGSVLNGITDEGNVGNNQNHDLGNVDKAYKTLINTNGNLAFNIQGGNVGVDTNALTGKQSGFGVNASTRDYTESINVNVAGAVSADATDNNLFNLRAKDSNLNIDAITTDGNVMITATDWKQADVVPAPSEEEYYQGYSVLNASTDNSKANITGKNISIIASDNIGSDADKLTYNQLVNGSISAMAENDVNILGLGGKDTIWQLISKRGNLDFTLNGDAEIREITAGDNLKITSKGQNLTIYDLGKISSITTGDDILYPHDGISFDDGDVTPEQLELKVIGKNSTLNIYNAYVRGSDNGKADVIIKADNVIAHAYDAPSSVVSTKENPNGFNSKTGRTYANDITDSNASKNLKASGFNTVGTGSALTFDIQGVSKDDVISAGGDVNSRDYNLQNPVVSQRPEFQNPNAFTQTVAKAENVSISLNSGENSPTDNRGMLIEKLYADNAYVDTKDLNLTSVDTYITNYAEFINGNREATSGGYPINDDYRWRNIVDNDYKRNLSNIYNVPITSQLYTDKTGSFYLDMGDKITQNTKAPIVHYNLNNVISNPDTENSFFRLTYKDNKIQYVTTTPDFEEIDKSTYLPNKREFIRFSVLNDDGIVQVSDKDTAKSSRIISVKDISRGGLLVVHDGSLKMKEKFSINLTYNDISTNVEVEVVRLGGNSQAGLKFINMDKATANKILHMNMSLQANKDVKVKISCK